MKIETLVAAIDQEDHGLAYKMNLQTDALIGNQCSHASVDTFYIRDKRIDYLNTTERGVGRNRNLLLENATADICVLADDDMIFTDDYPQIIEKAFKECPDADILIFNLIEKTPRRYINKNIKRVRLHNYAKYGAARLALRRQSVISSEITFSLLFGGGAVYGSGEDTVFLKECLEKGLKIYSVPYYLAEIDQEASSTWFTGYNRKFFFDKGALYACLHPFFWPVFAVRYLIRYKKKYINTISFIQALKGMIDGGNEYRAKSDD